MGQQQLLLIMLGVIVVGVAITVGITLFSANAIEQKRNELINEGTLLASQAQLYYRKPKEYGGGGRSFTDWEIPQQYKTTQVGSYKANISGSQVIITATGNEVVTGADSIQVQITVDPKNIYTTIIH